MKKIFTFISVAVLALSGLCAKESVVVLRSTAALYEEKDSKTVKYASDITAGTVLEKSGADVVAKDLYTRDKTWKDVNFYAVKYNGNDYFIQIRDSAAVESADKVAVVTKDAVLFSKPHPATFRNAWIEPGTIVAEVSNPSLIFTEVTFFDTDDGLRRTRFVTGDTLSYDSNDIKSIQLLEKARTMKDEGLQNDFLNNAAKTASAGSGKISNYINSEMNRILGVSSFSDDDIVSVESYTAHIFTADGSKVNLRSLPGTAGEKVAQVDNGWECTVSLTTESTETIEGITSSWFYVQNGDTEGWVFGGYLQREENTSSEQ